MLSFDDPSRKVFSPVARQKPDQAPPSTGLLTPEDSRTGPLPASNQKSTSILPVSPVPLSPAVTHQLSMQPGSNVTRVLTGTLSGSGEATPQRAPVVIRGKMKRPDPVAPQAFPSRHRKLASIAGILILLLIISLTFLTASPLGRSINLGFNSSQTGRNASMEMVNNSSTNNSFNVVAQATATAVYHRQTDGYSPNVTTGMTVPDNNVSLSWPYGQCTYWANYYYHQLSGHYVTWGGNADQWVAGASAAGWNVSTVPHVPSIVVLMPYVQLASGYGHVAVVTGIINGTTVTTSTMNWWAYGGGWGIVSTADYNYGPGYSGIYFIWR